MLSVIRGWGYGGGGGSVGDLARVRNNCCGFFSNCSQQCNNWFFVTVIKGVAQKAGNTVIRGDGPKSR